MDVKYDIAQYLVSVKMSSKKRVLVEGRDDKAHIKNLFVALLGDKNIKIDTAENIKGTCPGTSKNNRAKIDHIHSISKTSAQHSNLYFLCDREYRKFDIGDEIKDLMNDHESDGNLSWTLGHSLENYFIDTDLMIDAFSFLSGSEFKPLAINLFKEILPAAIKAVAAITLSAKEIGNCSYPAGTVRWVHFLIDSSTFQFDINIWKKVNCNDIAEDFINAHIRYSQIIERSKQLICSRICRGHTSILMLQRIFAACLYSVGQESDEPAAKRDANSFANNKESLVSNALSEAWIRRVKAGHALYPTNLIKGVA